MNSCLTHFKGQEFFIVSNLSLSSCSREHSCSSRKVVGYSLGNCLLLNGELVQRGSLFVVSVIHEAPA